MKLWGHPTEEVVHTCSCTSFQRSGPGPSSILLSDFFFFRGRGLRNNTWHTMILHVLKSRSRRVLRAFLCLKMARKWHVQEKPMIIDDHNEDRRELLLWCKIGTRCSEGFSWSAAVAKHSLATSPWVSQNVFKWYKLPARSKDLNLKTNWLGSGFLVLFGFRTLRGVQQGRWFGLVSL